MGLKESIEFAVGCLEGWEMAGGFILSFTCMLRSVISFLLTVQKHTGAMRHHLTISPFVMELLNFFKNGC
jgi:hypothetical protein